MLLRKDRGARTDKLQCVSDCCFETAQVGMEYFSDDQRGGIYGTIYKQYFTTSLPSDLTAGDNVSRLVDHSIMVTDSTHRYLFDGWADRGSGAAAIYLTGPAGYGNLVISSAVFTPVDGWVEYCK